MRLDDRGPVDGGDTTVTAPRVVVLVEGPSDRAAIEALAFKRDRDLAAHGVDVIVAGGATAITPHLWRYGPLGAGLRVVGLCDAGEEAYVRRALERTGSGRATDRAGLGAQGWYVCEADLEDELIRALGHERMLEIIAAEGEAATFETFSKQPAQRDRGLHARLHRFAGVRSGRKVRYGRLLVEALGDDEVPEPLECVLHDALDA